MPATLLFCSTCGAQVPYRATFCANCGSLVGPAPAPLPAVATGGGYGGFWIRVVAALIDAVVVTLAIALVATVVPPSAPVVTVAAYWLYFALLESSEWQASLGKMALSLRVTDLEGKRISFARATGRHFAQYLSAVLLIGYIMVGFTEKKQGLHDMLAGTLVMRG